MSRLLPSTPVRVVTVLAVLASTAVSVSAATAGGSVTPYPGGAWSPEPATYGVHVDPVVMVPMDDGVNLRVQMMYPTDAATGQLARGPFPVLITQTPYSGNLEATGNVPTCDDQVPSAAASQQDTCNGDYFVRRGYIVMVADQRGTGLSGGGQWGFMDQRQGKDGVDLARWAADPSNVPTSSGVVGLFGCSALGISQVTTAAELGREFPNDPRDDPVKAMYPGCVEGSIYRDQFFDNGIPATTGIISAADLATGDGARIPITVAEGGQPALFQPDIMAGGDLAYQRAYWKEREWYNLAPLIVKSQIPALLYVSWGEGNFTEFDLYSQLQNAYFGRDPLAPMTPNQPVTGRYQLFVGQGAHGCCLDDNGVQLQWFDHWLKGKNTGLDLNTKTPMHLQMQGDGSFYTNTATYPFTENDQVLRLGPGTLGGTPADGSDTLVWAPHAQGVSSQSYETAPLSNGATIAGPIVATVYASSTNSNLQFATTLTDVDPSGKAVEISHGALVGSLSDLDPARTWSNQDGTVIRAWPLLRWDDYHTPNAVQKYEINIYTELYRVAPGHRLELTLATQYGSQDCASQGGIVGIPYGCYDNKPQAQTLTGGIYAVERTAQYPSALNLPLLPYHAFQPVPAGPTPTSGGTLVPQDWG